jgi:hypothetical protein
MVFSRTLWGEVTPTNRKGFDSAHKLLITYRDDKQGTLQAGGMSGGGVWSPSHPSGTTLWNHGDQVLIGIQAGWFTKTPGKPFVATRIECVKRLLQVP